MKNMVKLIGLIAVVAVIGFTMAGCGPSEASLTVKNASSVRLEIIANLEEESWVGTLAVGESKTITAHVEGLDGEASYGVNYNEVGGDLKSKSANFKGSITVTITDDDL
jgi:hypothetical protein